MIRSFSLKLILSVSLACLLIITVNFPVLAGDNPSARLTGSSQKEEFGKELEKGKLKIADIKEILAAKQKKSEDTKQEVILEAQSIGINTEDILPAANVKLQEGNGNSGGNGNGGGNSK